MAVLRLFIGLPLPEEYQQGLTALRRELQGGLRSALSWTREGNWHLTLKFLGETEDAALPPLVESLAGVVWQGFTLQAGGAGFFPPPHPKRPWQPRVLWTGLQQGAGESMALARAVEEALVPLGIPREERPFRPHLTVARIKHAHGGDDWQAMLRRLQAWAWSPCRMERFVLWQSRLGPGGPVYAPLREFAAGAES